MFQSEVLGSEVSLQFIDRTTGVTSWYRGRIMDWKIKQKKEYFTTVHFIEFDDGEKWWINLNLQTLQDNVRWHHWINLVAENDNDNDGQGVVVMEVVSEDEAEI